MNTCVPIVGDRAARGATMPGGFDELQRALAEVRRLYDEEAPREPLLDALDTLIASARSHREALIFAGEAGHGDATGTLGNVIEYLGLLRGFVERFGTSGPQPDLHLIHYWIQSVAPWEPRRR